MSRRNAPRQELSTVLAHEYRRASLALQEFHYFASLLLAGDSSLPVRLTVYDAYGRFVHHLFEFYKGCFETDGPRHSSIRGKDLDRHVQEEVVKLMGHRAARIARGDSPALDNDAAHYREQVPPEFARDFRRVRNQLAHTLPDRAEPSPGVSLPGFYARYHRFAMLLYEEPYWLWHVTEESSVDWKEIGRFEEALKLHHNVSPNK